jgi:quercetin dioxygenase-like cupin family protein
MPVLKSHEAVPQQIAPGRTRTLIHLDHLMMVIIDFTDGSQQQPDPYHSHPHEQITYCAKGEVLFFLGDEQVHLHTGDMVAIPGGVPHTIQLLTNSVRLVDTFHPIREEFIRTRQCGT